MNSCEPHSGWAISELDPLVSGGLGAFSYMWIYPECDSYTEGKLWLMESGARSWETAPQGGPLWDVGAGAAGAARTVTHIWVERLSTAVEKESQMRTVRKLEEISSCCRSSGLSRVFLLALVLLGHNLRAHQPSHITCLLVLCKLSYGVIFIKNCSFEHR